MFTDPTAHLKAQLARLDLLLHRQILRLRASYQLSLDEFRGLYISDEQVDSLINQAAGHEYAIPTVAELTARAEAMRQANATKLGDDLPWQRVVEEFSLSPFEQDVLLLALAPEIDLKYETLYAYLNNDVSRKWPTCDMALRLFSTDRSQVTSLRKYLLPEATLFGCGLLQPVPPATEHPSWLAGGFSLAPAVSHHLLGLSALDPCLTSCVTHIVPAVGWDAVPLSAGLRTAVRQIANLFQPTLSDRSAPMLIFEGHYGAGRALVAEALCRDLDIPLLRVDMSATRASPQPLPQVLQALMLQQRLQGAGVLVERGEALFDKEGNPLPDVYGALRRLAQLKGPAFFACTPGTRWHELMKGQRHLVFRFDEPDYPERRRLWEMHASQAGNVVEAPVLEALANRFILTPGQIRDAILAVTDARDLNKGLAKTLSGKALFAAARSQSDRSLGRLALKVNTIHTWDDLVLPPVTLGRVKEIATAIKHRHIVYSQWGFERRISSANGLMILFSGASGTGKTMTAGVVARDLGLDLYKIDLSGVVSKYIGETEKNLDRIFRAARCSNAILFFDEADALFGKRSEVKDAHDRYANIEVAYLLQKMEDHEGVVILASNLSKNIDRAFCRRMHYVVEFPLPDETLREQLWRGMFAPQAPLDADVDFRFLARQFPLAGGDIKNVALDAAFLAAQDGQVVTMKQLIKAMARQMIKQGKVPSATDFKQYHALIAQGA